MAHDLPDPFDCQTLPLEARAERPRAPGEPSESSISAVDELHAGNAARKHRLIWVVFALDAAVLATLPLMGGHPTIKVVLTVSLVACALAAWWLWWLTVAPGRLSDARALPAWLVIACMMCSAVAYFGVFSPAPVVVGIALYFVSQSHELRVAFVVYIACASALAGLAALVVGGASIDPGLITAERSSTLEQLAIQVLVQGLLLAAFVIGHGSRRAAERTVASLESAIRAAAQREAMLVDARDDLLAILRVGEPGRFTDQVIGSYRLGVVIGHGAMGEVYEGTHAGTGRAAAVKLLRRDAARFRLSVRRFLREASAVAALDVPNVVRVFDTADATSPVPFIAMERLRGYDLAHLLRERTRLAPGEVVELVRQVARGVDAAHRAGIVHRDLKPQNLFRHRRTDGGVCWKILDFGVSKLLSDVGTMTGTSLVGTPAYMAPEQAQGLSVGRSADIHALGVIAFRALTGELPYRGTGAPELLYAVVHSSPPRASRIQPSLSAQVDQVFSVVLAKLPGKRYPTAAAFAEALAFALSGDESGGHSFDEPSPRTIEGRRVAVGDRAACG